MTVPDPKFPNELLPAERGRPLPWPDAEGQAPDRTTDVRLDAEQLAAEAALRELTPIGGGAQLDRRMAALWAGCADAPAATAGPRRAGSPAIVGGAGRRWLRPTLLAAAAVAAIACGTGFWLPIRGTGRTVASTGPGAADPAPIRPLDGGPRPDGRLAAMPILQQQQSQQSADDRDATPQLTGLPAAADEVSADDPGIDSGPSVPAAATASADGTEPAGRDEPVGLQQTFERVANDGVVLVDGPSAYQRYRRDAVRRIVVVDPETGRSVTVSVPTQEIVVRRVESF